MIVAPRGGFSLAADRDKKSAWWWISREGTMHLMNLTEQHLKIRLEFESTTWENAQLPSGLTAYDTIGKTIRLDPVGEGAEVDENRLGLGPLWIAPSRLMENKRPNYTPVILRPEGKGSEPIGVRNFRIEELR